jgi:hypothetical protein
MEIHLLRVSLLLFYLTILTSVFVGFYYDLMLSIDICENTDINLTFNNIITGLIATIIFYRLLQTGNDIKIKYDTITELLHGLLLHTVVYFITLIFSNYLFELIAYNIVLAFLSNNINNNCAIMTYKNTKLFIFSIITTTYIRDMMTIICLSYGY